ncbi:MAG: hypothetical protein IJG83_10325, partial [Thermoguttaceae bacterium]|nr:hypothetical protein [Thermoguttaceae bacterium]
MELRPANDALRETTETAVLELVEYGTPSYTIGTAQSEIQIIDNDQWTVNVQAETALSAESTNPQAMTMRISRSGETDLTKPLTVYFRLGGTALYSTDYTLSGGSYFTSNNYGSVTIAAGQSSAVLSITPVNDALRESSETVILSLIDSPIGAPTYSLGADTVASGTIADNDQWVVNVTAINGAETNATASPVQFIFTRTGETDLSQALTVYYRLGGTAAYGTDYTVSGYNTTYDYSTIIIGSGAATATLNLSVVNDAYLEDSETIDIEILSALPENYQPYSGYGPQTIPPINYLPGEDSAAAAVIIDNDQWTVTAEATAAAGYEVLPGETAQPIQFTISRSGSSDLSKSLTVYYELSGSATLGSDYTISGAVVSGRYGYVTIAAGAASAVMTASIINDAETEGTETVILTLLDERPSVFANGGYTLYSEAEYYLGTVAATGYIADQANSQTVAVTSLGTAKETSSGQTAAPARWLFTRSGGSNASALYVFYTLGGTAAAGSDYTAPTQYIAGLRYIQIPAGQETAQLSLSISDDTTAESAESVIVTVVPLNSSLLSWGYTPYIIAPDAAAAETIIQDNDTTATIVVDGPASVAQDETVTLTASIGLDPYGAQNWVFLWDTDADGVNETVGNSIAVNGGLYSAGGTVTFSVQAV